MMTLPIFSLMALISATPSGDELQEAIVRSRMKIQQGTVKFTVDCQGTREGDSVDLVCESRIDFDGDQLRFNYTCRDRSGQVFRHYCNIRTPKDYIVYQPRPNDSYSQRVYWAPDGDVGSFEFHPRVLGAAIYVTDLLSKTTPDHLFRDNRLRAEVFEDSLEGRPVLRLVQTALPPLWGTAVYWVDVDEGYAIPKSETEFKGRNVVVKQTLNARYRRWPTDNTSFPEEIQLQRYEDGKPVYQEQIKVTEATFGVSPDKARFGMASMDIPPGTRIDGPGKSLVWDGQAAVQAYDPPMVPAPEPTFWRFLHRPRVWIGIVSASLAVLLFIRFLWGRRRA